MFLNCYVNNHLQDYFLISFSLVSYFRNSGLRITVCRPLPVTLNLQVFKPTTWQMSGGCKGFQAVELL